MSELPFVAWAFFRNLLNYPSNNSLFVLYNIKQNESRGVISQSECLWSAEPLAVVCIAGLFSSLGGTSEALAGEGSQADR